MRDTEDTTQGELLAATDPANPYGATLKWLPSAASARGATRTVGASVVLVDGALAAYLARGDRQLLTWIPEAEPQRSKVARAVARALLARAASGGDTPRGMLIEEIDGVPASLHPLAPTFVEIGFIAGALGVSLPRQQPRRHDDHEAAR
jgi:ATP-dependent Lhr-like helicase